jgi:hypothetical protein
MTFKDYMQYKWFFTSSGKLVVGGKSASQNDQLLHKIKDTNQEFIIMHTSEPGSPFSVIISDPKKVSVSDLEQTAIFTASFSRAWRSKKKTASVDIFKASQISKSSSAKTGTWSVKPTIKRKSVTLSLVLTKQKGILRAVPESSVNEKSDILLKVKPGKVDKEQMLPKLQVAINGDANQEQILAALPAGGVDVTPTKKVKKAQKKSIKKSKPKKSNKKKR